MLHTHTRRTQQEQVQCNSVGKFPQPKIFLLQQYVIYMQCGWCQSGLQHWPVITNAHTHTHSRNSSFLSSGERSGSSWKPGWKSTFFVCCSKFENDECSERMPIVGVVVERQTWYLHANAIVEPLFWINKYRELDRRGRLTMDVHRAVQGCENLKYQISNLKSSQNKFLTLTFQNFKTCKSEPKSPNKSRTQLSWCMWCARSRFFPRISQLETHQPRERQKTNPQTSIVTLSKVQPTWVTKRVVCKSKFSGQVASGERSVLLLLMNCLPTEVGTETGSELWVFFFSHLFWGLVEGVWCEGAFNRPKGPPFQVVDWYWTAFLFMIGFGMLVELGNGIV